MTIRWNLVNLKDVYSPFLHNSFLYDFNNCQNVSL